MTPRGKKEKLFKIHVYFQDFVTCKAFSLRQYHIFLLILLHLLKAFTYLWLDNSEMILPEIKQKIKYIVSFHGMSSKRNQGKLQKMVA